MRLFGGMVHKTKPIQMTTEEIRVLLLVVLGSQKKTMHARKRFQDTYRAAQ